MTNSHQQSIADVGSETRPPIIEKGSYVMWATRFMRAKQTAKAHDHLTLVAKTYASPSQSRSSPAYYVKHPPSVDVHTKNVWYIGSVGGNTGRNAGSSWTATYVQKSNGNNAIVQRVPRTTANSGYTPTQQMLLAKQDEARIHLDEEQNDFLLADIPENEELQELNTSCIMMAHIQEIANDSYAEPSYDSDFMDEVQDPSSSFLEGLFSKSYHEQNEGINSDNVEHDNLAHDQQSVELEKLLRNVQIESANTQRDKIQTQFLVEKQKNEACEKEQHDLAIESSIQVKNISLLQQEQDILEDAEKS
ncbi:hypothetical protein Tco_0190394 [Tanacetum coccineum]